MISEMSLSKPTRSASNPRINFGKLLKRIPTLETQVKLLQVTPLKIWANIIISYFLQDRNILPKSSTCSNCHTVQHLLEYKKNYVFFRCRNCWSKRSVRSGTILSKSKISLRRFILLCYTFVQWTWKYTQSLYSCFNNCILRNKI